MADTAQSDKSKRSDFLAAGNTNSDGLVGEMFGFLKDSKKWWLAPIIIGLLLIGLGLVLGGTAAAPFIYATF
jgi:hypothetical protein